MAHFAELDENNIVTRVIVIDNSDCEDSDGNETEAAGISFCQTLFGDDTTWVQTSYNKNIRKNFAGIGFTYDSTRDAFIEPKPYNSWTLNETTCTWECPVELPDDASYENPYQWNEDTQSWNLITKD